MTDLRTPVPFGQTGLQVSRLGIGSSFTGDPAFIEEAVEQGVNYLYWGSIRRPAFATEASNSYRLRPASTACAWMRGGGTRS